MINDNTDDFIKYDRIKHHLRCLALDSNPREMEVVSEIEENIDAQAKYITELEAAIKVLAAIVLKEHNDSSKFVFAAEPSVLANSIVVDAIKQAEKDR